MGPASGYTRSGVPSRSGMSQFSARSGASARSGRSKSFGMTQNYLSRVSRSGAPSRSGGAMGSHGPIDAQQWQPTGNAIEIDEAELAELHRMIAELQQRIQNAEERSQQLGSIREKDILKFIIKNSLTARGGTGNVKGKKGSSTDKELTIGNTVAPW